MSTVSFASTHRGSCAASATSCSELGRQFTIPTPEVDVGLFFRLVHQSARGHTIRDADIVNVAKQTLIDASDEEITESIQKLFKHAINGNDLIVTAENMLEGNQKARISRLMHAALVAK